MTEAAILDAIRGAMAASRSLASGGMTSQEIVTAAGLPEKRVRAILHRLAAEGRLRVGRRAGVDLAGRNCAHVVYHITE